MHSLNLPSQTMPFIGRGDEISAIVERLADPACCLLTLVGPGGIGKTRLAIEAAKAAARTHAPDDGIHFVDLQPINSVDLLIAAIANAVGILLSGTEDPRAQLLSYLNGRSTLLLLDNFEQLLDSVDLLADIVRIAPEIKLLVTSREALNIQEEWVWQVGGLQVPEQTGGVDIESYSAVQLFAERARRTRKDFVLTGQEHPITRICQLVQGMPLAIELAAAWVRALSCTDIADQIARSLDLLESPMHNVEPRHRTMRAAFEPTWERLTEDERSVFKKLSVFRGGFTHEAAKSVASASLRTLSALVDKSLIRMDEQGRYNVHELLRQYAAEEWLNAGREESLEVHGLHCAYYAEFIKQQLEHLKGRHVREAVNAITTDIDNVRAAWDWAAEYCREDDISKATVGLGHFYHMRGWLPEASRAFTKAVASLSNAALEKGPGLALAKCLVRKGAVYCYYPGNLHAAQLMLEESLTILQQFESGEDLGHCYRELGGMAWLQGNYELAREYLERSVALFTQTGDRFWTAYCTGALGHGHHLLGNEQESISHIQQSLTLFREIDSFTGLAITPTMLAQVMFSLEDYAEAQRLAEQGLQVSQEIGFYNGVSIAHILLAETACKTGDQGQAWCYIEQALGYMWQESHDIPGTLWVFPSIARLLVKRGDIPQALELLALVLQQPASHGEAKITASKFLRELEQSVSAGMIAAATERAKTLRVETVAAHFLSEAQLTATSVQAAPPSADTCVFSQRELAILNLIAQGFTNPEIAAQLMFSVNTIKWYVKEIFSKLHVHNRTQAVTQARALKLLD